MTASYNETLSTMFAKGVRNGISEVKADESKIVYNDIFPNTKIKYGDASMSLWSLEGGYNNYLATSPGGTATGFGATCFVEGTKVWTEDGEKNIEDVKPGDFVYSMDEGNYRVELKEVIATKISKKIKTVVIKTALGVTIECTEDHPIYVYDYEEDKRKYVEASKIKEHHSLNYEGFFVDNVLSIEEKAYKEVEVYDIQVKDNENFFANGILVHNCLIVDDLIKNAKEAFNSKVLEDHWEYFTNTMLSRIEEGGKIIIIMTRWSSKDLAGRALDYFTEEGKKVRHINMKAMQDDGTMLCEEVLSKESYLMKTKAMSHEIAMANYQQEPIDVKGRLYTTLKTYSGELPRFKEIKNYTDTADSGSDYLASINYGVTFDNQAYILDVLYTQDGMEITEEQTADLLHKGEVNVSDIESNNGGKGFARNVERILKSKYGSNRTVIRWFHQGKNKEARILSASHWVMENVYFPENWRHKWPEFYKSMMEYQRTGKNAHDDAQDAITGLYDKINSTQKFESW